MSRPPAEDPSAPEFAAAASDVAKDTTDVNTNQIMVVVVTEILVTEDLVTEELVTEDLVTEVLMVINNSSTCSPSLNTSWSFLGPPACYRIFLTLLHLWHFSALLLRAFVSSTVHTQLQFLTVKF